MYPWIYFWLCSEGYVASPKPKLACPLMSLNNTSETLSSSLILMPTILLTWWQGPHNVCPWQANYTTATSQSNANAAWPSTAHQSQFFASIARVLSFLSKIDAQSLTTMNTVISLIYHFYGWKTGHKRRRRCIPLLLTMDCCQQRTADKKKIPDHLHHPECLQMLLNWHIQYPKRNFSMYVPLKNRLIPNYIGHTYKILMVGIKPLSKPRWIVNLSPLQPP